MRYTLFVGLIVVLLFQQCMSDAPSKKGSKTIIHKQWTELLQKHVDENGYVNYLGFKNDSTLLNNYLEMLVENPPDEEAWSDYEQIAYWINVYNAFTIKLIINHYPLESIKDIGSSIQIPFVNSPWDIKFIMINGEKLDLNSIEHSILRKKFNEPRIHFAINCASFSCPKLRKEAFTADKLNRQLNEQAIAFINDPKRNIITPEEATLSKIFSWFKGDFTKNGSLPEYLNNYSKVTLEKNSKISFIDYDWSLNEQH